MGISKRSPLPMSSRSTTDRRTVSASTSPAGVGSATSATRPTLPSASTSTSTSPTMPPSVTSNAASTSNTVTATATGAPRSSSSSKSPSGRRPPSETTSTAGSTKQRSVSEESDESKRRKADLSHLILVVCQQPERARLCSYKEENDTVDRRPVDPPPVVELASTLGTFPDQLDSTHFFIRASLVSAEPNPANGPDVAPGDMYTSIRTPTGADPTSGEVIQTPERLKHLDGSPGALCIFPKLSVRLPGVFRLKFTLFETGKDGISEITHVISEQFEVFSPKLFKGMHESTRLTRHLANQGLKVKLRTDPNGGKGTNRRRASVASYNASSNRAERESPTGNGAHSAIHGQPSQLLYAPLSAGPASAPPYSHQPRHLVWHPHYHHQGFLSERDRSPASDEPRKRARTSDWRDARDDGLFELDKISSRLDLAAPSPSSDLSAFSLGHQGHLASPPGGYRWGPRDAGTDDGFPTFSVPHSSSAPPPRRQFSDPRSAAPQESYSRDRQREYGRDSESLKGSPRVSPEERQLAGRERELARERDVARERALRERESDLAWERDRERERDIAAWERAERERDPRDRRGVGPHWVPVHRQPSPIPPHSSHPYAASRSYSPRHSQPPLPSHGLPTPGPAEFALPRLPPIVAGEPIDPRAPHPGHAAPYPPPHGHHQSHLPHTSPQTAQGHTFHPPYPPLHSQHGRPHSATSAPSPHSHHAHANHHSGAQSSPPPLLPPIRERSPARAHMHRPYDRDPRR